MAIQDELYTLLSPLLAGRMYPNAAPDKPTLPYLVYGRISARKQQTMEANGGTGNLVNSNVQLDVYTKTYSAVIALSEQIQTALQGWARQNIVIFEQDFYESEEQLHRIALEVSIWHR